MEAQDDEPQPRGASIWMRRPPTENENVPASADELSSSSAKTLQMGPQSRFIGTSPSNWLKSDGNRPFWM